MPLRPFPFQLGVGTDIVCVSRIRAILDKSEGNPDHFSRFLRRILTPSEQNEFVSRYEKAKASDEDRLEVVSRYLAGRWAAKEATIKAVSWRRLSFHDIAIVRRQPGYISAIILDTPAAKPAPGTSTNDISSVREHADGQNPGTRREEQTAELPITAEQDSTADELWPLDRKLTSTDHINSSQSSGQTLDSATHTVPGGEQYESLSGQIAKVSISHDGGYATAVCLAALEPMDGDVGGEAAARELS